MKVYRDSHRQSDNQTAGRSSPSAEPTGSMPEGPDGAASAIVAPRSGNGGAYHLPVRKLGSTPSGAGVPLAHAAGLARPGSRPGTSDFRSRLGKELQKGNMMTKTFLDQLRYVQHQSKEAKKAGRRFVPGRKTPRPDSRASPMQQPLSLEELYELLMSE